MHSISVITYSKRGDVNFSVSHEEISYMFTLKTLLRHILGQSPERFPVFAGHDGGEVRAAGVQIKSFRSVYPGALINQRGNNQRQIQQVTLQYLRHRIFDLKNRNNIEGGTGHQSLSQVENERIENIHD